MDLLTAASPAPARHRHRPELQRPARASASSSKIVGASMTVGLILAVLALIISAIVWALGANSSNPHLAGRGKLGVLVAPGRRDRLRRLGRRS